MITRTCLAAMLAVLAGSLPASAAFLVDDFASGLGNWYPVVYNSVPGSQADPGPAIDATLGRPAPSLDVNGNSNLGNAVYSKTLFDYAGGLSIEWDMLVTAGFDWNWGWGGLGDHLPDLSNQRPDGVYLDNGRPQSTFLAGVLLTDDGAFNTAPASLSFTIQAEDGMAEVHVQADASALLGSWHRYRIQIRSDRRVEFRIDGVTWWITDKAIDPHRGLLPVVFGERDENGPVRIDNVRVYPCAAGPTALCLNHGRFQVEVTWREFQGLTGDGQVVAMDDDSGLFAFFVPSNWELMVKVLDACSLNDRYWIFSAGMTNVEYRLTILDTAMQVEKEYLNPLNRVAVTVTDTSALDTCP